MSRKQSCAFFQSGRAVRVGAASIGALLMFVRAAYGDESLLDLSLEELLDVQIVTPSKKSESVFDSPLSVSAVTREEIQRAGVTSIPESLRLVPGVIVREQTNGNFDVFVRGFAGLPSGDLWTFQNNSTTLVMIDQRVVYNYFWGGTMWPTLPIGLDDVERIEVIRGPASALYGPNAVSGVINIITRRPQKEGLSTWGTAFAGSHATTQENASVSYMKKDAWNATLTVNHAYRDRKSGGYYNYNDHAYHNEPAQPAGYPVSFADAYPEPAKALEQTGVNSFLDFKLSDSAKLEVQGGFQHSFTQSVFAKETTPLLSLPSSTGYGDVRLKVADLDVHASYSAGTQEGLGHSIYDFTNTVYAPGTGPLPALPAPYITGAVNYAGPPVFDYVLRPRTLDTAASYELKWGHWAAKPEVAFRNASDNSLIFGGSRDLTDFGAAVKLEYALSDWRLVGAVRGDRYNTQNKYYGSWELAATRKLGESQLLRAVWSRANKFPTFLDAFANARFRVAINNPAASSAYGSPVSFVGNARTSGDTGLDLQTEDLYELGHRAKFGKFMFDTELFDSHTSNIAGTTNPTTQQLQAGVPIQIVARGGARQIGIDQSVAFNQSPSWQHRIYYTLQNTARTEGGVTVNHPGTPMLYGGFVENFRPTDRWNINLNPYYYTASAIRMRFMPAADPDEIQPAKLIVNLDVSYEVRTGIRVFADARNLFNNQNREFAFTDLAGGLYLLGFNVDL